MHSVSQFTCCALQQLRFLLFYAYLSSHSTFIRAIRRLNRLWKGQTKSPYCIFKIKYFIWKCDRKLIWNILLFSHQTFIFICGFWLVVIHKREQSAKRVMLEIRLRVWKNVTWLWTYIFNSSHNFKARENNNTREYENSSNTYSWNQTCRITNSLNKWTRWTGL